ncbi:MAG: DUF4080 domain-containing protein [Candidatus Izemoplasma sp.]
MKTILIGINAKFIHTNNAIRLLKANSDFDVDFIEYTIKDDVLKIVDEIIKLNPTLVGFSAYIWNIEIIKKVIEELSKSYKNKILIGGPEVSYESEFYIHNTSADYIIKGEGEYSFNMLLHALNNNTPIEDVINLTTMVDGVLINNPIEEILDLTTLNMPYYFEEDIVNIPNKIAYIETSRGCPYKCSYCLSSLEKTVRFFDMEEVKKSILYLLGKGAKTFKFLDRTFNANKQVINLFDFIIKNHKQGTVFQFEITGDVLPKAIIEYVNEFAPVGLFRFEIGIQSTNEATNLLVNRIQNTKKLFENIKLIEKHKVVDLHLDLIAGLPKEDLESFKKTFNEVFELGAKELQLGFLKMLRGTKIRNESEKYSYEFLEASPYQITKNESLSPEDLDEIHDVEHMLEMYHNKGYFNTSVLEVINHYSSSYDFFRDLSIYYKTNNLPTFAYQVDQVYGALLNFLKEIKFKNYADMFDNIKRDYLLRSKVKPKIFWDEHILKTTKLDVFLSLVKKTKLNINFLYKYGYITTYKTGYLIVTYQNLEAKEYIIN